MRKQGRIPSGVGPLLIAVLIIGCGGGGGTSGGSGGTKDIVFASYGGTFQAAQDKALFGPCAASLGAKLTDASAPSIAQIKLAAGSGKIPWDVIEIAPADLPVLLASGLLQKIDYSVWDKKTLNAVDAADRQKYNATAVVYDVGIAYNSQLPTHPTTWSDFWNTEKFPGPRGLPTGTYPDGEIFMEPLLAQGVPPDKLFPIDFTKLFASLGAIKPSVKVWYNTPAAGVQALTSGDVNYAALPNGRVLQAKSQGAHIDFEYSSALEATDYFVVLNGAPNASNAMKCIGYVEAAAPSLAFMKLINYGMPNKDANTELASQDAAYAKTLPTYPANAATGLRVDWGWFSGDAGNGSTWEQYSLARWNAWFK